MKETLGFDINCASGEAVLGDISVPCRIGRDGYVNQARGKEGDGKTPLGNYMLRWGFFREDRLARPPTYSERPLTWRALQESDGWCDDVSDPAYNRFIRLPSTLSHEKLWREDGAYDILLVLSHNDSPPQKGLGSAVFIHVAQADDRQTLGCVALAPNDMVKLLPRLQAGMPVKIYS